MKYIRTKDNRIVEILQPNEKGTYVVSNIYNQTGYVEKEKILKQADTIDKLCDTFVICVDKQGYLIIDDYKKAMEKMRRNDDDNAICYGAIWCDWGLKYVAKMIKERKMELL